MRGWLFVGQKCTSAMPSPSRLYTVTISSIPAVLETMALKFVFTGRCLPSVPSHSPARACSFLKADAEYEAPNTLLAAVMATMATIKRCFRMGPRGSILKSNRVLAFGREILRKESRQSLGVSCDRGYFDDGIGHGLHHAHKRLHHFRVELRIGAALQFRERLGGQARLLVRAVAGNRVIGV